MAKRFGVEIECVGDSADAIQALEDAGIAVLDRRHTHLGNHANKWTVKRDGSVGTGGNGVEVVSPPLDFTNESHREQVTIVAEALYAAGLRPHSSAGIHVHVEAVHEDGRNLTAKEIAAVVRFTYKFEDAIYRIASSGWETGIRPGVRTYALPIPEATAQAIMHVQNSDDLWQVWQDSYAWMQSHRGNRRTASIVLREQSRYTATNLMALHTHNTIEFRYFNSSLNAPRIQAYIALCMAIVDDARNGFSRSVKKSYPMGSMLAGTVTEQSLFMRLQQIFRSNGKDTKVCMSEADWKNLRNSCWRRSTPQANLYGRTPAPRTPARRRIRTEGAAAAFTRLGEAATRASEAFEASNLRISPLDGDGNPTGTTFEIVGSAMVTLQ